jgi:hypothetical protein
MSRSFLCSSLALSAALLLQACGGELAELPATAAMGRQDSAVKAPGTFIPSPNPDTASVDAILAAAYEAITHAPGEQPDWDRLRQLFHPQSRLVLPPTEGEPLISWTLEEFAQGAFSTEDIQQGFHEREIARRTEAFGNMVHVWSTYESRYLPTDPEPFEVGINSWQLVKHEGQWQVINVFWDVVRPGTPLPNKYTKTRD